MIEISHGAAALAGLLSFLSPCVLPMVPFYLCYLAGMSMGELRGDGGVVPGAQRRLVIGAIGFALGVTTIFVLLGLGATAMGQALVAWRPVLRLIAAAILALFGLHFLGIVQLAFLNREARLSGPARPATLIGAYAMGLAFGFGWTPCVGPALAAILFVAAGSDDLWRGFSLLLTYGLAMTLPFVLVALFARRSLGWLARHRRHLVHVERAMGAMLLLFAVLIATGRVNRIADWLLRQFDWSLVLG